MNALHHAGLLASALLFATTTHAHAATATTHVKFGQRALAVALWFPERTPIIRGVLVITGGRGAHDRSGDTRPLVESRFYQRVAASLGFALLGSQFRGAYTDAASGPGQALLEALGALAIQTKHPELARAPLLMHGFSDGGYFGFAFAQWKPARVIAFCLNKSGFAAAPFDAAFLAVPGLFVYGELEVTNGVPTVVPGLVREGRLRHALWAELIEWGRGHEEGEVERVVVPFFADMVEARYPKHATPAVAEVPLIALDEAHGWLGDHGLPSLGSALPTIAAFGEYPGDPASASWLPSQGLANLWRGFVTKQPITLRAPGSNAQLSAAQRVQLTVAGLEPGERVTFYDGDRALAPPAAVHGGKARTRFQPASSGVRGIVALASSRGKLTRTSRPVAVVLHGKPRVE